MMTLFISQDLWEFVDKDYEGKEIPPKTIRDVQKKDVNT